MTEEQHELVKNALLEHIREIFEEIEEDVARSHEERYALLEDLLENASEPDELRVAFEQWHAEHSDEIDFGAELEEIWDNAIHRLDEKQDNF